MLVRPSYYLSIGSLCLLLLFVCQLQQLCPMCSVDGLQLSAEGVVCTPQLLQGRSAAENASRTAKLSWTLTKKTLFAFL